MNFVDLTGFAWALAVAGLAIAGGIYGYVTRQDPGNETMVDLGEQIHDGAMAFLRREYTMLAIFAAVLLVVIYLTDLGPYTAAAFLAGALSSAGAGWIGMYTATKANVRTTNAAHTQGQAAALSVAFFGGPLAGRPPP